MGGATGLVGGAAGSAIARVGAAVVKGSFGNAARAVATSSKSAMEAVGPKATQVASNASSRGTSAAGDATKVGARGAENAANGVRLGKQLASQQQMGEPGKVLAGSGSTTPFRGAGHAAQQYGGEASEYAKMGSSLYRGGKGVRDTFETHWVERVTTGERFDFKTKFPLAEKGFVAND